MSFCKEEFLKTEVGKWLKEDVKEWHEMIEEGNIDIATKSFKKRWRIFKIVLEQYHGVKYDIEKDCYHYGIATKDKSDWLFQFDRLGIIKERGIYKNADKKCNCWECEIEYTCPVANKSQRLPRESSMTGLGQCLKLKNT